MFQTFSKLFITSEDKIEICGEIRIKWSEAVLFSHILVGPTKLQTNFIRPNGKIPTAYLKEKFLSISSNCYVIL